MIFIVIGFVMGILIALDAARNLRAGIATTVFGTYSRTDRPAAFGVIAGSKLLMSALLLVLASLLLVRSAT